jgi:protoporphyrinogen oxidase
MAFEPSECRVVVVGGGYTGLVAALRLAEAGKKVVVYEAGPAFGGLAGDFHVEGAALEKAYHHLFRTDTDILNLSDELGVSPKLRWLVSKQAVYFEGHVYPFSGALDLLRFRPLSVFNRIRAGVVVLYLQLTNRWQRLVSTTAYEWMTRAGGVEVMRVIWGPLLRGKFHRHYDKVSMAWLWARVHIRANSKERGDRQEKLGYFDGGFAVFTEALLARLETLDVELHLSSPVASIASADGAVRLTFTDGQPGTFEAAVLTVPSGAFARMVVGAPQDYLDQLRSIEYLGARLLIFSSTQDLSEAYWHNINDRDIPFVVFINHTRLVGTAAYGNNHIYYVATYLPMDDEAFLATTDEVEKRWFEGLQKVFPNFDATAIREKHHFTFGNAQHVVGLDYESKIPDHRTPLRGVYLANFSQIYPEDRGTNFAVRDGQVIAQMVLDDMDLVAIP